MPGRRTILRHAREGRRSSDHVVLATNVFPSLLRRNRLQTVPVYDYVLVTAHRAGNVDEALWWWQFSYVNNWGNLAGAALNALITVVAHDRFDTDFEANAEAVAVADEMLEGPDVPRP